MSWRDEPITKGELYDIVMKTHDEFQDILSRALLLTQGFPDGFDGITTVPLKMAVDLLRKIGTKIEGGL